MTVSRIIELIDFNNLVERFKQAKGFTTDKQVATLLGLSQQDFASRKQRGTILAPIIDHALSSDINLHWLITGVGSPTINSLIDNQTETQELMIIITEAVNTKLKDMRLKLAWKYRNKMIIGLCDYFLQHFQEEKKINNAISIEDYMRTHRSEIEASISASAHMSQ